MLLLPCDTKDATSVRDMAEVHRSCQDVTDVIATVRFKTNYERITRIKEWKNGYTLTLFLYCRKERARIIFHRRREAKSRDIRFFINFILTRSLGSRRHPSSDKKNIDLYCAGRVRREPRHLNENHFRLPLFSGCRSGLLLRKAVLENVKLTVAGLLRQLLTSIRLWNGLESSLKA